MPDDIKQVKDGNVFTYGRRVTVEPKSYAFPLIWEEEPGGNLVVRNAFNKKTKIFPKTEYKEALKFSEIRVFNSPETWKVSKNTPVKIGSETIIIPKGCLSLWGEMST
jgi:hypothetical protein